MPTLHTFGAHFQGTPTELVAIYNKLFGPTDYQKGSAGGLTESPSSSNYLGSNRSSGSTCSDCCQLRGSVHSGASSSIGNCSEISSGGAVGFIGFQQIRPRKLIWERRRRIKLHRHFRVKAANRNKERQAAECNGQMLMGGQVPQKALGPPSRQTLRKLKQPSVSLTPQKGDTTPTSEDMPGGAEKRCLVEQRPGYPATIV
jgi:hypothetical protein